MAEATPNHSRKPSLVRARDVFATPDKFIALQRGDAPLGAWLLENMTGSRPPGGTGRLFRLWLPRNQGMAVREAISIETRPPIGLRAPGSEPRKHEIDSYRWNCGLGVDDDWKLRADPGLPSGDAWMATRDYIEAQFHKGFDLEIWVDANECRVRGLLPQKAATDRDENRDDITAFSRPSDKTPASPELDPTLVKLLLGYTDEDCERFRDWLLGWEEPGRASRGDSWRTLALAKAKEAAQSGELKGIKIRDRLLRGVIRRYPEQLQKRHAKAP